MNPTNAASSRPSQPLRRRGALRRLGVAVLAAGLAAGASSASAATKAKAKPKFALSVDESLVTVGVDSGTVVTLSTNRSSTFDGSITLKATAARKGLSVVFDENPMDSDDADITVVAKPGTTLGRTTISIVGSSGSTRSTWKMKVNITATKPAFAVAIPGSTTGTGATATTAAPSATSVSAKAEPAVLALAPGQVLNSLVTVTGFAAGTPIVYEAVGLPAGVTAEYFPNGSTAQVRLTAAATAANATAAVSLKVSQGALSVTIPLAVSVGAAAATSTSTTVAGATSTTTTAAPVVVPASTTTVAPAAAAYLVMTRLVNQTNSPSKCDNNSPVNSKSSVSVNFVNTATTPRVLTQITPNTCQETAATPLGGSQSLSITGPAGYLVVSRSASAGNPIRRIVRVPAGGGNVDVGGTATYNISCLNPVSAASVTLTDGEQKVISTIAAGSTCTVTEVNGDNPRQTTDNVGSATDQNVTLKALPAGCAVPTAQTAMPSKTSCYAELLFSN